MTPPRTLANRWLVPLLLALLAAAPAHAQVEVVPITPLPSEIPTDWVRPSGSFDVAAGRDGRALAVWSESAVAGQSHARLRAIVSRIFDPRTATFGPLRRTDSKGEEPRLAVSAGVGTYLTTWSQGKDFTDMFLFGRTHGADGEFAGVVAPLEDDHVEERGVWSVAAAGDDIGHTVAWGTMGEAVVARRVGRDGSPGLPVVVETSNDPLRIEVANTPDGGVVVAESGPMRTGRLIVRGFTATGVPKGDLIELMHGDYDLLFALAASPNEDLLWIVVLDYDVFSPVGPYPLLLWRITSAGTALGPPIVVAELSDSGGADAAIDRNGNLYVTWTVPGEPRRARAYRPDGTPVGPTVDMPASAGPHVKTARLADDDFVNVWAVGQELYYDIVSLCVPGSAVCGDGTLDTLCERCDDGPANSDATPDACRTDCERAHCGDGVVDAGESCDDGNTADCDGCSGACVPEPGLGCGDSIPFPACGEACDDGNPTEGDGCVSCALERGLGGGLVGTDCFTAWSIDNPANDPRYGKTGAISDSQVCTDNDSRCDFDGGVAGSCTFHMRVCANNTHLAGCAPGTRLSQWDLRSPSAKSALSRPAAAAVRDALMSVVPAGIVGSSLRDVCSPNAEIPVALRGTPGNYAKARVTLKTRATLYDGRIDNDKLRLECRP